ncbi:hypothetical protein LTR37_002071 [Vermiconidia calcicola]|uniref:Uncharacterized protein n=1 Tax=Vermiconidia calcicola TaxID=1690605 RepID=A0ACC3NWE2_9PEZI|nr:hypothetical protein LTR37_002071 [Vermiconidia calcicola]
MWPRIADGDHILGTLIKEINEYRMESLQNFSIDLLVRPTPAARPIFDRTGTTLGFDEYIFEEFGTGGKCMAVRICSKGVIKVWHNGCFSRISSYMKHLQPFVAWDDGGTFPENELKLLRWEQQSRWWLANGKKFRILELPSEIREVIYAFAFGAKVEPYPTNRSRRLGQYTRLILTRKPNSSLLRTCKLIYQEASNILFMYTPFYVEHYGVVSALLRNIPQRSSIRQLELALTHDDFFRMFGGKPDENGERREPSRASKALRRMNINRLELKFAPPSAVTASDWLDGACQKTVVDWILEAAWPAICGHPVQISGYVKNLQKRAFEASCLVERKRFEFWQGQNLAAGGDVGELEDYDEWLAEMTSEEGGVRLDGKDVEVTFEVGLTTVTEWTPVCLCKTACMGGQWDPEE